MRLIQQYSSASEAEAASEKLKKRGILTHVSSARSHRFSSIQTGAVKVGLWGVLNNQYRDACKIVARKQCKVRHPLSEEQMLGIESESKSLAPRLMISGLLKILLVLIGLVGITLFLTIGKNA